MRTQIALLNLVARRNLDAKTAAALWRLAGFDQAPPWLLSRARSGLLIVGTGLAGLGLIFGVAANWALLSRVQQFTLLQMLVLGPCAGMAFRPRARAPLALLALIAIGALLAYFGQTYPTGADKWQLFALWAALGLPLAACARADSVWSVWGVITLTGIALWNTAHTRFGDHVSSNDIHAAAAVSAFLLTAAMSPAGYRYTGAGRWAFSVVLVLSMVFVTATALMDLRDSISAYYGFCVILAGAAAFAITRIKPFDVFAASMAALSLEVLIVAGLKQWWIPDIWNTKINLLLAILLIGLSAIGMTVRAVKIIVQLARRDLQQGQAAGTRHIDQILRDAAAQGLVEDAAAPVVQEEHRWPVMAFTALAAWLSAFPLATLIALISLDSPALNSAIGIVVGMPILAGTVLMLRRERISLFVEQLGLPGLLMGATFVAYEVEDATSSMNISFAALAPLAGVVAALAPQAWIRALMGAAIGVLIATSQSTAPRDLVVPTSWLSWLAGAGLWLLLYIVQRRIVLTAKTAPWIAGLEAVLSGMAVATLLGIAWSSGQTFLATSVLGGLHIGLSQSTPDGFAARGLGAALAAGTGFWLAWRWPRLRTWWHAVLAGAASLTAWFVPALGPVLLILSMSLASGRHRIATLGGGCAVWLMGALYYMPAWTLAAKSLLLMGVGLAAALIARYAIADPAPAADPASGRQAAHNRTDKRTRASFLLCGLLVLSVVNTGIWQKESLLRTGTLVYVELDLTDPRSLMQGDYMRLGYALPWPKPDPFCVPAPSAPPTAVVAWLDQRSVAHLPRFYDGDPLAHDEFLIQLAEQHPGLTIATDAWYVKEGEAKRWSRARYAEFRVAPDGQALLVGLRGPNLEKL
jgi:uncharacterized membrane-anchored protein